MADFTEKDVYEAFGLGEQAQEVADPAAEGGTSAGEQVQEVADPATADSPTGDDAPSANQEQQPENPAEREEEGRDAEPLTPEQRRKNADIRRQREKQAQQAATDQAVQSALEAERQRHQQQMTDLLAGLNLRGADGEPITNAEQLQSWQKQMQAEQLSKELKAGRLTPELLEKAIGEHPVIKQAQQLISQNEAAEKARRDAEANAEVDAQIAEIRKLDASIKSLDDLMNAPYWPELYAKVSAGYSIKDAHFLINYERLEKAKLEAARVAGADKARGKDHLTGLAPARGNGSATVPAAQMAMYRAFNPTASDAEIQAHYQKLKKT